VSSLIKKQAKRYQGLSEKIDDLCRRIVSNSCFISSFVLGFAMLQIVIDLKVEIIIIIIILSWIETDRKSDVSTSVCSLDVSLF